MDPMAFSLASESTETTPVPSLATGTAPQPPATANGADTTTASGSLAKAASDQKDDKANKTATDDDVEIKDPDRTTSLQVSWARRAKIKDEIRRKVGVEFSPVAIDTFLDNTQAIDLILKGIAYEEPLPENPIGNDPREIAKPEIKLMSWGKWRETALPRDAGTREHHSAIDVLYEEPQPLWASSRRSLLRIPRLSGAAKVESRQHMHNKEDGPMSAPGVLPSRLRINSVPAKRLLDSLCNDELAFSSETDPLIIVRPFKVLTIYEDQITNKMAEIEQIYDERLKRAGTAKAHLKQKDENVEAARRFESHNNNIGTVDVDGNAKIQPKNDNTQEAEFLAQRRFPRDMIFFTGTEWSELTLSEIKEAVDDFRCLVRFINEFLRPVWIYFKNQPTSVHFSNIWHLFPAESIVFAKDKNIPQKLWKVIQAAGGRRFMSKPSEDIQDWDTKYSPFVVDCYHLDYDGTKFIRVYRRFKIEVFEDAMPIASLPIMPLSVAEQIVPGVSRESLRKGGKEFLDYTKPQHRYYQGTTITQTPRGEPLYRPNFEDVGSHRLFTERVESQVVIDFERGIQANPEWGPVSTEPDLWKMEPAELEDGLEYVEKDNVWDARASEDILMVEEAKRQQWNKGEATPDDDDLLLFPERVFGYVLRTRSWACLRLNADDSGKEHLTHVDQRADAWQDLEIPAGHKTVVKALINTHFSKDKSKDAQFDLVREKGKGVIILLHGVPGVGKTATAECVAASHGKPLLPITCGDLGLKPKEVEATLQTAFQLAQAWDCVMLLDEADIFLAQRTNQDIERNALVSVFLRILEYYEGILFLTTNRVGVFDEAFKSRIHMALYYPPLKWLTTEKIWRNLIRRARESPMKLECDPDALIAFAWQLYEEQDKNINSVGPAWNGRQIRNAFQSAIALARNESTESNASLMVEPRHFKTVAEVSNEFNHYIWRVKSGRTDADIAKEVQSRYDNFSRATFAQGPPQSQSHQFPPPSQTPMPMRQAAANVNSFQSFSTPQSMHQQPTYTTAAGSPYNTNQSPFYGNAQPPPQFNLSLPYDPQQAQYAPPSQQYPPPVASTSQPFQTSQAPPAQQFQPSQAVAGQQYQTAQPQAGYAPQYQPAANSGYTMAGAAEQIVPSQDVPLNHPRA